MKLIIRREAELEISRAYTWYEKRRRGLGEFLVIELDHCFNRIEQHPKLYAVVYRNIRKAPLHTFPFSVYYLESSNHLTVLRVLHQRQHQPEW